MQGESLDVTAGWRSVLQALAKKGESETLNDTFTLTQTEAVKELITRQFHDNSLDVLIDHLTTNNRLKPASNTNLKNHQYVLTEGSFDLMDIDHLKSFADKDFLEMIDKSMSSKEKNERVQKSPFPITDFNKMIHVTSLFLPTELFIRQGKFIVPLSKEYLRESSRIFSFKREDGEKIKILGKVRRQIVNIDFDLNLKSFGMFDVIDGIESMAEGLLAQLGVLEKGDYVISPIAIYFETP